MVNTYKSDAFESTQSSAAALLEIGAIDEAIMREFGAACIAEVPAEIKPDQIKRFRSHEPTFWTAPGAIDISSLCIPETWISVIFPLGGVFSPPSDSHECEHVIAKAMEFSPKSGS